MNLKTLRTREKLTQEEFADKLGIKRATYANYENGVTEPPIKILVSIADFFDVSIDYLLNRDFNKIISSDEQEILDIFGQLNSYQQGKVIGYCKSMAEGNKEAKEKELRESIKKKS